MQLKIDIHLCHIECHLSVVVSTVRLHYIGQHIIQKNIYIDPWYKLQDVTCSSDELIKLYCIVQCWCRSVAIRGCCQPLCSCILDHLCSVIIIVFDVGVRCVMSHAVLHQSHL